MCSAAAVLDSQYQTVVVKNELSLCTKLSPCPHLWSRAVGTDQKKMLPVQVMEMREGSWDYSTLYDEELNSPGEPWRRDAAPVNGKD